MSQPENLEPASPVSVPAPSLRHVDDAPRVPVPVLVRTEALKAGLRTHTCLQCGLNPVSQPVARSFQYVPPWVYIGLLLNVLILMILYFAGRVVVKGSLSLCPDCDRADRRGRTLRGVSLLGLLLFPLVGLLLGAPFDGGAMAFGAAAGLVAAIAGMVAAARSTRGDVITARLIDKKAGVTTLVASPELERVLSAEAPEALAR